MEIDGECEISIIAIRVGYNVLIAGIVAAFCLVGITWVVTAASQDTSIDGESVTTCWIAEVSTQTLPDRFTISLSYLGLRTE